MQQLPLSFHNDEQYLKRYFENEIKKNVSLVITDNSTSMLSIKKKGNTFVIRLHRIFLSAGKEVLGEMFEFIKNKKAKTPYIRNFINQNTHLLKMKPGRKVNMKTQGRYYDLLYIFNSLNKDYFEGNISASITWGKGGARYRARKRTLGSYNSHNNLIRINPVLDTKRVPRYFLEFVVYHEMLHADLGVAVNPVRRTIHSKEFRKREIIYKHYHRAIGWEKKMWV
ncbi:MAG: SprT-like domain-containing protein [Nitrospirae bacterium]|nr:SprT-like domain-containing protein [Nitrospirota bacterium]